MFYCKSDWMGLGPRQNRALFGPGNRVGWGRDGAGRSRDGKSGLFWTKFSSLLKH